MKEPTTEVIHRTNKEIKREGNPGGLGLRIPWLGKMSWENDLSPLIDKDHVSIMIPDLDTSVAAMWSEVKVCVR